MAIVSPHMYASWAIILDFGCFPQRLSATKVRSGSFQDVGRDYLQGVSRRNRGQAQIAEGFEATILLGHDRT